MYDSPEIDPAAVAEILDLMDRYQIEARVRETVTGYHDQAVAALTATGLDEQALAPLMDLTRRLESRTA
jgi:geranylgeranyl pyrophosphate synthase